MPSPIAMRGEQAGVDAAEEKMLAGLETLGQVRDAMKKRLGTMQMQASRQQVPPTSSRAHEQPGSIGKILAIRDKIATQQRAVQVARGSMTQGEGGGGGGGGGGSAALVESLDALVDLMQELISMTLLPAMQQVSLDESLQEGGGLAAVVGEEAHRGIVAAAPSSPSRGAGGAGGAGAEGGGASITSFEHPPIRGSERAECASRRVLDATSSAGAEARVVSKNEEEREGMVRALSELVLMSGVPREDLEVMADAMVLQHYNAGATIILQGDAGERWHLAMHGTCDVYVDGEEGRQLVGTVFGSMRCFGEVSLMYGEQRSATVVARTDAAVWSLDQSIICTVVLAAQAKRRSLYVGMLGRFPVLSTLTPSERGRVADVMGSRSFSDGEIIIEQGEEGHLIFFIEEGGAVASRSRGSWQQSGGNVEHLVTYGKWSYFGELALMTDKPRAATVRSLGETRVCFIDKHAFSRLLGPAMEVMRQNFDSYSPASTSHSGPGSSQTTAQAAAAAAAPVPVPAQRHSHHNHHASPSPSPSSSSSLSLQQQHQQAHRSVPHGSRRGGVSGPSSTQPSSPPGPSQPEYPKSKAAIERIKRALPSKFLFSHLEEGEVDQVVGAFSEVSVSAGEDVVRQGDDGDNFYLVGEGELEVVITDGSGHSRLVSTLVEGDMFGELALMYNCPRAATVRAVVDGRLYALRQDVFQHIVRSSAQERRMQYEHFLARVPLLQGLSAEERGRVADVLVQASYKDGEYIIRQGDQRPDSFFILLEGFATARKSYQGTAPVDVMQYKRGDYFGEVALLNNVSRCADVVACGDCKVVSIDRMSFTRLLGALPARTYL